MVPPTEELKHLRIVSGHYPQLVNAKEIKLKIMEQRTKKHKPDYSLSLIQLGRMLEQKFSCHY